MREKFKFAGETVKIKSGVGKGLQVGDMSGMDFVIEDWCENVLGCHWGSADGNPAALEYAMRSAFNGANNNVLLLVMTFYMEKLVDLVICSM